MNWTTRRGVQVPKICGLDSELGNFILGMDPGANGSTGFHASRMLLREINGYPEGTPFAVDAAPGSAGAGEPAAVAGGRPASHDLSSGAAGNAVAPAYGTAGAGTTYGAVAGGGTSYGMAGASASRDWGRKFLASNGGCVYIDLDHLELCVPEVRSAHEHVAAWHAMLRIARGSLEAANQGLPEGQKLQVLVNNSDGLGNSYGSHLNLMVSRQAWDAIFHRQLQFQLQLASYQVSSILFTGQGKVGSENDAPAVPYQISQRADFFECLSGWQTTHDRPIVNSRDEPLCAGWRTRGNDLARLHVIFYDNTLAHVASLLKVGVMQIMLAMIEAGEMHARLILDDPLEALLAWSHDPELQAKARLCGGEQVTAAEHQLMFLEAARRFAEQGGLEAHVPRWAEILDVWEDTLLLLARRDFEALAGRLDWVLKRSILETVMDRNAGLDWGSAAIKHLDHAYSDLDREHGLYWAGEHAGDTVQVVGEDTIVRFEQEPPADTRAWGRAMLLRRAGAQAVSHVDWNQMRFSVWGERWWPQQRSIDMPDPRGFDRRQLGDLFELDHENFEALLDELEAWTPATTVGH